MGLALSSNSLVNDGKTMRLAATEVASRFKPRAFVDDAGHSADIAARAAGQATRDPHVLLATTGQLPSTARLAMELHEAGARVSLIAPDNHPARVLGLFHHQVTYRASAPRRCLEATLRRVAPDLVIPCDERTVRDLHAIAGNTENPDIKRLIEASTAPVRQSSGRLPLARHCSHWRQQEGVRVPPSMPLPDKDALERWTRDHATPFVLKADGSWAGFGVRIISDADEASDAYTRMTRPVSARVALREVSAGG